MLGRQSHSKLAASEVLYSLAFKKMMTWANVLAICHQNSSAGCEETAEMNLQGSSDAA